MTYPERRSGDPMEKKIATFERHWQSLLLTVITASLLFGVKFIWDVNAQLSTMVAENKSLTLTVAELKGSIASMQTNYVTRNEFTYILERLKVLEDRQNQLRARP